MKGSNLGLFAVAAAIVFVGALWVGVPLASLALLLVVLACPLMMIFMMKGMSGERGSHPSDTERRDATRDDHSHS